MKRELLLITVCLFIALFFVEWYHDESTKVVDISSKIEEVATNNKAEKINSYLTKHLDYENNRNK